MFTSCSSARDTQEEQQCVCASKTEASELNVSSYQELNLFTLSPAPTSHHDHDDRHHRELEIITACISNFLAQRVVSDTIPSSVAQSWS